MATMQFPKVAMLSILPPFFDSFL